MKFVAVFLFILISAGCVSVPARGPDTMATLDTIAKSPRAPTPSAFTPTDIEGQWTKAAATIKPRMAARDVAIRAGNRSRAYDEESAIRQTCKDAYSWWGLGTEDEMTVRAACKTIDYPLP